MAVEWNKLLVEGDVGISDNNLLEVDDADAADNDYAKFTAAGLEGRSYSEVLGDLSGQAGAAFAWNSQNLTGVGTIGCGVITGTSTAVFEGASVTIGKASTTTGTIVLHDSNSANTVTIQAPDVSAGSLTFTLPATDGDNTNVLQTDGNGVLTWAAAGGGTDEKVKVDGAATAGYIGAASSDGILRTGAGLTYTDGGDFVTLVVSGTFVDRGDPAAFDFTQATMTEDGAWYDMDLSSICPAGAIAVCLRVQAYQATPGDALRFRENGNSNEYNISRMITQISNRYIENDLIVALDGDRKIEYKADSATWDGITVTVKGWWI